VKGWTAEESGFDSRQEQEIYLISAASRQALRHTQPPIQWVFVAVSLGAKRPDVNLNIHFHLVQWSRRMELYLRSPASLHFVLFNYFSTGTSLHYSLQAKLFEVTGVLCPKEYVTQILKMSLLRHWGERGFLSEPIHQYSYTLQGEFSVQILINSFAISLREIEKRDRRRKHVKAN
jgi:hypothetical protein